MAKLYFYYSSMNAGKTTTLLQASYNYQERGMTTLLFTPMFDERFGKNKIVSRIGIEAGALGFDSQFNFFTFIEQRAKLERAPHCIMIDEAQFLQKTQVESLCDIVDILRIPVLTYGLRTNFLGEPFEGSKYLLAWADELSEIKGVCHCGAKATMVIRVDRYGNRLSQGAEIDIGGNEKYIATCRKHFRNGEIDAYKKVSH